MSIEQGRTLLSATVDRGRVAVTMYTLRRAAHRLVADCECILESLQHVGRQLWYDPVVDALVGSRQLLAVLAETDTSLDATPATQSMASLASRVGQAQRRIVDAMTRLLQFVPVTPDDEMLLRDARAIRTVAEGLLAMQDARRSGAMTIDGTGPLSGQPRDFRSPGQRARVLVADDEHSLRDLLRRFLTHLGCDVLDAENGSAALDAARRESPDLIITDINMPHLDGVALLKELKGSDATRDIPVIVVSGEAGLESVVECIAHGAEDYLSKPYEPTVLGARVQASLERKRMRDVERHYLGRVALLTVAAEAADRDGYVQGSLDSVAAGDDALGHLARVFDRLVSGLRSREERLQYRLKQLRHEMSEVNARVDPIEHLPDAPAFGAGGLVAGRYRVIDRIGSGGMGMVYHAKDLELGEDVALKVVRPDLVTADPTIVERLKSEVRLARKISHPNVARTHDFGEWEGTYFISMEYVEGITVSELIDRRGRLSVSSTLAIGTQLAEALSVAHEQQIVHRDIKPANLIVNDAGVLKVMDFGIARSLVGDERITVAGLVIGTPDYMAPEQLLGGTVDARSDLYAVGVVLYECLTGRTPFGADSGHALLAQLVDGTFVSVSEVARDVPRDFEALIHQQLQFQPHDRIGSARDLAHKLSEIENKTESAAQ